MKLNLKEYKDIAPHSTSTSEKGTETFASYYKQIFLWEKSPAILPFGI